MTADAPKPSRSTGKTRKSVSDEQAAGTPVSESATSANPPADDQFPVTPNPRNREAPVVVKPSGVYRPCVFSDALAAFWGVDHGEMLGFKAGGEDRLLQRREDFYQFTNWDGLREKAGLAEWTSNEPSPVLITREGVERLAELWARGARATAPKDPLVFESLLGFIELWIDFRDGEAQIVTVAQNCPRVYPFPLLRGRLTVPVKHGVCQPIPQGMAFGLFRWLAAYLHLRRKFGAEILDPRLKGDEFDKVVGAAAEEALARDRNLWRKIPLGLSDWQDPFTEVWHHSFGRVGKCFNFIKGSASPIRSKVNSVLGELVINARNAWEADKQDAENRIDTMRNPSGESRSRDLANKIEEAVVSRMDALRIPLRSELPKTQDEILAPDFQTPRLFAFLESRRSHEVAMSVLLDMLQPPGFRRVTGLEAHTEFAAKLWEQVGISRKYTPHLEYARALYENWVFGSYPTLEDQAGLIVLAIAKNEIEAAIIEKRRAEAESVLVTAPPIIDAPIRKRRGRPAGSKSVVPPEVKREREAEDKILADWEIYNNRTPNATYERFAADRGRGESGYYLEKAVNASKVRLKRLRGG